MSSSSPSDNPLHPGAPNDSFEDAIDIRDLLRRLGRGLGQTLGFALLGLALAAVGYLVAGPFRPVSISTRVVFAFDGFERGEYPDHSKFQSDDLRAPEIIAEALKKLNLETTGALQSEIRGALSIEGIIPAEVVKQRDRVRSAGQTPSIYVPDEYVVALTLPRKFPLTQAQRERLLSEIISVFQEKFQRTYARLPVDFGNVHDALKGADYPDYVLILEGEIKNITDYLDQQIGIKDQPSGKKDQQTGIAKSFRSSRTNLSFTDLRKKMDLFKQIQLDNVLGLIRMNSLTRNKENALMRMDYALLTLKEQEQLALEQEKVSKDYLSKTETRSQNYVMGIKSQAAQQRADTPLLDQGLIDSLLANDSYNFTLREALKASLEVKRIQSEMAKVEERKKELNGMTDSNRSIDRETITKMVDAALKTLLVNYDQLIDSIRETEADYARQQFGNAVRLSDQITTANGSVVKALIIPSAVGGFLGIAFGMGLSLLGVYIGSAKRS